MKLHWLQHVPFEGLGYIEDWAEQQGFGISCTRLYEEDVEFPDVDDFDWLVVMGGPMGIFDYNDYPWLTDEKEFIETALDEEKIVIGICLGAQLIADLLGAKVYPGNEKEIGWFPVTRAPGAPDWMPEQTTVFHWHGDTFDLPAGSVRLCSSESCVNQGFLSGERVLGLQFHLETTTESMEALIRNCSVELNDAPFIQTAEQMRAGVSHIPEINALLATLLNNLLQVA